MGKSLIIPGADFSANAIYYVAQVTLKPEVSDVTFTFKVDDTVVDTVVFSNPSSDEATFRLDTTKDFNSLKSFCSNNSNKIKSIVLNGNSKIISLSSAFFQTSGITTVKLRGDFTGVQKVDSMFQSINTGGKIDISEAIFSDNLTNVSAMFTSFLLYSVGAGEGILDLSALSASKNIVNTASMFSGCAYLLKLVLSGCDFSNVTKYGDMFGNCSRLKEVVVEGCNDTTKQFLIARLADAGYTFTESSTGHLTKG